MGTDKKKVLVIEDDDVLRTILSEHLSRNYEIVQAEDGKTGLDYVLRFKPDLVILDLMLPNLPGLEVLEQIRKNTDPAISGVKVIIFSNLADNGYVRKAYELSVTDYLVKANTDMIGLVKKVSEHLQ